MEVVQAAANLLGISPAMLLAVMAGIVILAILWGIVKTVLRIAWKTFSVGCVLILILMGGLVLLAILSGTFPS